MYLINWIALTLGYIWLVTLLVLSVVLLFALALERFGHNRFSRKMHRVMNGIVLDEDDNVYPMKAKERSKALDKANYKNDNDWFYDDSIYR